MATKPKNATRTSARITSRTASSTSKDALASAPGPSAKFSGTDRTKKKTPSNSEDGVDSYAFKSSCMSAVRKVGKHINSSPVDPTRESIRAYLRIKPHIGEHPPVVQPYLTPLSDSTVRMSDPQDHGKSRASTTSTTYTFSRVFAPDTSQSEFFTKTTLPLVGDFLRGQNGLLFTYGVTNSGKSYTVQGGSKEGSAGIIPRALDVIFNSIEGLHGDCKFCPVRLQGIESSTLQDSIQPQILPEPVTLAEALGQQLDVTNADSDIDPTILEVDRNYQYTVWVSFAEIYNEKVFDLLASVKENSWINNDLSRATTGKLILTRMALPLKTSPASDHADSVIRGKYIFGLRQFQVHTATQAKSLVKFGQLQRRVFGTLANKESSRSHGMVIIKVIRGHKAEKDDPEAFQVSRLTLVDLAGSERTKYTHTTGDRLREAGNINKSLMVLGQCMETMLSNQRKLAMTLSQAVGRDDQFDARNVKKVLAVVPFRHSKLTESLMDYFSGEGRVVTIVNVNPYDTGYDENLHVVKFASLAKEVQIASAPTTIHRLPNGIKAPGKISGSVIKELGPLTLKDPEIAPKPYRRKVTISMGGGGKGVTESVLEVLEEDEPIGEQSEGEDDEPINPLVDALFDEVEMLRMQLFEAEMRCAVIEAETREEVTRELELRMRSMEEMHARRLMNELEQNELKTDAKIDMLHQSGLLGSPIKMPRHEQYLEVISEDEEDDVEKSLLCDNPGKDVYVDHTDDFVPIANTLKNVEVSATTYIPFLVSDIESEMNCLSMEDDAIIIPRKGSFDDGIDDEMQDFQEFASATHRKKKRQLGKQLIMTEELIEKATHAMEKTSERIESKRNVRRLTNK